jgi:HSP20 family molecular chaperone IbpA
MSDMKDKILSNIFNGQFFQHPLIEQALKNHKNLFPSQDMSWIEEQVQHVLHQTMPAVNQAINKQAQLDYNLFETHDYMIVRINAPQLDMDIVNVYLNLNQLILEGLPKGKQTIILPAIGRWKGCKAVYKNNVLEIRVAKLKHRNLKSIPIERN